MNDPKFGKYGGAHGSQHPSHGPAWKRVHRSPFFWVAALFIMLAMVIYVATNNLSFWKGEPIQPAAPAARP